LSANKGGGKKGKRGTMPEPNWDKIEYFKKSEFPEGIWPDMDRMFMLHVNMFRHRLERRVFPTPIKRGFVRKTGSKASRHYAVGRLSDAGDFFPDSSLAEAFETAAELCWGIRGIGIYWDTRFRGRPWGMVHLDRRDDRLWWARVTDPDGKKRYIYPSLGGGQRREFYRLLSDGKLKPPRGA